jgi:hypothetical protein
MLQNVLVDVGNYNSNISRVLRIIRKSDTPTLSRQIGHRALLPDGSPQTVLYNCTAEPCLDSYDFQIDRIDQDLGGQGTMIRARFSLEAAIVPGRSYAFFFEGCCRPPQYSASDPTTLAIINNFARPFHLRAEVLLAAAGASQPAASIKFVMPDQAACAPLLPHLSILPRILQRALGAKVQCAGCARASAVRVVGPRGGGASPAHGGRPALPLL